MGKASLNSKQKKVVIRLVIATVVVIAVVVTTTAITCYQTTGRTQIQFDIHMNKDLILLSTYSEPPQFAIWLENADNHKLMTVFITRRVSVGDWEGKTNVPVALPQWVELFRGKNESHDVIIDDKYDAVTGATPKNDYFSVRAEVKPGSRWICWIEMNLAGDFNEAFPQLNLDSFTEDEFSCGQPALLYKANITATEGMGYIPELVGQSVWEDGQTRIEPVNDGVTTARNVFDTIQITVIRPKPKLIDKYKIMYL